MGESSEIEQFLKKPMTEWDIGEMCRIYLDNDIRDGGIELYCINNSYRIHKDSMNNDNISTKVVYNLDSNNSNENTQILCNQDNNNNNSYIYDNTQILINNNENSKLFYSDANDNSKILDNSTNVFHNPIGNNFIDTFHSYEKDDYLIKQEAIHRVFNRFTRLNCAYAELKWKNRENRGIPVQKTFLKSSETVVVDAPGRHRCRDCSFTAKKRSHLLTHTQEYHHRPYKRDDRILILID